MKNDSKKELPRWVRWYIKGEYHCEYCPYSWEDRGEEDADAGCHLFGELRDSCRFIRNPISQMIVNKRRNRYDRRYDGIGEWYANVQLAEQISDDFEKFANEHGGTIGEIVFGAIEEYESKAHPSLSTWEGLKNAFKAWHKDFWQRHFWDYVRG